MGMPGTSVQVAYRFRTGDTVGLNTDSGWEALQNTAISVQDEVDTGTTKRVRVEVEETTSNDKTVTPQWECRLNTGTWQNITTSSTIVKAVTSGQYNEGDLCSTSLLTGSSATHDGNGEGTEDGLSSNLTLNNTSAEWELAFQVLAADVTGGDTVEIRLNGLDSWTATATINITAAPAGSIDQNSFRIRIDDSAGLNAAFGAGDPAKGADWSAGQVDQEFRIRFLLQATVASVSDGYELWYSKNGGAYAIVPNAATPWLTGVDQNEVALVPSDQYTEGAATTELLAGSGTFVTGEGRESEPTGTISLSAGQDTEVEWCILIRKLSNDGHIPDGTYFDFRMRYDDGTVLDSYTDTPRVTIGNRAGQIGGAFAEAHGHAFIEDKSGNLYAAVEYSDYTTGTYINELAMLKSTDGGDTWALVDESGRPGSTYNDIEALDMHYVAADNAIYVAWFKGNTAVYYVEFYAADHATLADTWDTVETVDTGANPEPSSGFRGGQWVQIRRRSDGTTICAYSDGDGTDDFPVYKKRTSGGTWDTTPTTIDSAATDSLHGPMMELDSNDDLHMFYSQMDNVSTSSGTLKHKRLSSADSLSGSTVVETTATLDGTTGAKCFPMTIPQVYNDGATEKVAIAYIDGSNKCWFAESPVSSISFSSDVQITTTSVETSGGGSKQLRARLIVNDDLDEFEFVFVAVGTPELVKYINRNDAGTWSGETTLYTGGTGNELAWLDALHVGAGVIEIFTDEHPTPGGTGGSFFIDYTASGWSSLALTGDAVFVPALSWPTGTVTPGTYAITGDAAFIPALSWPVGAIGGTYALTGDAVFIPALSWPTGTVAGTYPITGDAAFVPALSWPTGTVTPGTYPITGDAVFVPALSWPVGTVSLAAGQQDLTGDAAFIPALSWPTGTVAATYPLTGDATFVPALSWPTGSLTYTYAITGDAVFVPVLAWPTGTMTWDIPLTGDAAFVPALTWPTGTIAGSYAISGDAVFVPALSWPTGTVAASYAIAGDAAFQPALSWPTGTVAPGAVALTGDAAFTPALSWATGLVEVATQQNLTGDATFIPALSWPTGAVGGTYAVTGDATFIPALSWPTGTVAASYALAGDATFVPALVWPTGTVTPGAVGLTGDATFVPVLVWPVGTVQYAAQELTGDALFVPVLVWAVGTVTRGTGPVLTFVHPEVGQFWRLPGTEPRLVLGWGARRGMMAGFKASEGWEKVSGRFLFETLQEENPHIQVELVWAAYKADTQTNLTNAINAELQSAGYRAPGGGDLV